eukprot:TRINITY_DN30006_c0_g1_i1.p1 TRINITY_DN30006_c0_g1~~TRINITY_DN30006_c0_g1_i1.p1  ORF type:complete len:356 (+),score=49.51 TRINITY_DN30006_c0_g1_i1:100-1167(+)
MERYPYLHKLLFGGAACAAAFVSYRCCARRQRDPPATGRTGQTEGAAAAAGAPPKEQEQECAPAAEPAPGRVWKARRLRAEVCPDDFVSEREREEQRAAAADVSFIQPGLYLSSYLGSGAKARLQAGGVTGILCLDAELKPKHPGDFAYKSVDLQDDLYSDIIAQIPEALDFIQQAQQQGGCLVHCEMGRSRSATMVLAWLMLRGRQDLRSAWDTVYAARPSICPNVAFKRQLLRLQQMAHAAGGDFQDHALLAFHQAESALISTKPATVVQNSLHLCIDPAEYVQVERCGGGGGVPALKGVICQLREGARVTAHPVVGGRGAVARPRDRPRGERQRLPPREPHAARCGPGPWGR